MLSSKSRFTLQSENCFEILDQKIKNKEIVATSVLDNSDKIKFIGKQEISLADLNGAVVLDADFSSEFFQQVQGIEFVIGKFETGGVLISEELSKVANVGIGDNFEMVRTDLNLKQTIAVSGVFKKKETNFSFFISLPIAEKEMLSELVGNSVVSCKRSDDFFEVVNSLNKNGIKFVDVEDIVLSKNRTDTAVTTLTVSLVIVLVVLVSIFLRMFWQLIVRKSEFISLCSHMGLTKNGIILSYFLMFSMLNIVMVAVSLPITILCTSLINDVVSNFFIVSSSAVMYVGSSLILLGLTELQSGLICLKLKFVLKKCDNNKIDCRGDSKKWVNI